MTPITLEAVHVFPVIRSNVINPLIAHIDAAVPVSIRVKPVDKAMTAVPVFDVPLFAPTYPLETGVPPEPIRIVATAPAGVVTPASITVTRFTQDGMLVKSMLVPLVEATEVPCVIF